MAKSSVGIYISARYVDIAELKGSLNAPQLVSFIREEIPAPPPQAPEREKPEKEESPQDPVAPVIRTGLKKLKAEPASVYTVLLASDVMIRYFSMPQLPKSERFKAVKFEARKYIPFKINEIVSSFKILPSPKQRKTTEVLFIAATKERLDSHLDLFKRVGKGAIGVDVVSFALVRMLLLEKKIQAKESSAILYIDNDKESASIHVIDKGMPFLSRDFKISIDDKEAFFEKIASELRVSLGYFRRQNPQAEVSKIVVCGESLFVGLDAFIADELKIITETLEQPQAVKGTEKTPPSSIVAIGIALGGLGKSPYSINLSPMALAIKKKKVTKILLAESVMGLFIVLVTFLLSHHGLRNVSTKFNAIKEKGLELPAETSALDIEALRYLKEQRLDEIEFLWLVLNNRLSWTQKLDRIAKKIPEGVWIESLTAQDRFIERKDLGYPYTLGRNIHIIGSSFFIDSTKESDYITKLFTSLKEDNIFMRYFDDIALGSIDKREVSDYWVTSFKIFASSAEEKPLDRQGRRWQRRYF